MSRLALYRKWRPTTFDDVVEQRHVVDTLKNTILKDAIGHAYLFCGTRGTGKTTMAKVFSRAINCLQPINGNPCNQCSVCTAILEGSLLDVIEMDAASNNGVDNIRDIRDEVIYAPSIAKYKVYIIDEVHMLSSGAFNALLKTLEEPPDRVVFILATTEPQKLPATVLSRCQRFDFKRITEHGIAERLAEIAKDCGVQVTDEALKLLARLAGGALRDAISLLDQLTTLGSETIDIAQVNEMAGFASNERICDMSDALVQSDIAGCWSVLDMLMREGRDLAQLCVQLINWFRNVLLLKLSGVTSPLLDIHPQDMNTAMSAVNNLTAREISEWLQLLSEHDLRLRRSDNPRIVMEVLLLKLCMRTTNKRENENSEEIRKTSQYDQSFFHNQTNYNNTQRGSGVTLSQDSPLQVDNRNKQSVNNQDNIRNMQSESNQDNIRNIQFESNQDNIENNRAETTQTNTKNNITEPIQVCNNDFATEPERTKIKDQNSSDKSSVSQPFKPWQRIIEEIQRSGMQKLGGMKLYAYIMNTACYQVGNQLQIVAGSDDVFKKKMLSQADSIEMIDSALLNVTGEKWVIKIVDQAPKNNSVSKSEKNTGTSGENINSLISSGNNNNMQISSDNSNNMQISSDNSNNRTQFISDNNINTQSAFDVANSSQVSSNAEKLPDTSNKSFSNMHEPVSKETQSLEQTSNNVTNQANQYIEKVLPIDESTGNEAIDQLLSFGREAGIPVVIQEDKYTQ